MDLLQERIAAIQQVHKAFVKIMEQERCRTCSCLHKDVLASVLASIDDTAQIAENPTLAAARKDFASWIDEATRQDLHA
jgi:hypothetical protein